MSGRRLSPLLVVVAARLAAADPNPERADAEFERGRQLLAAHRYDDACAAFSDSLRDDFQYGTLYNLATCEESRGHLASALRAFRRIEAEDRNAERRTQAKAASARLAKRVARLVITVPAQPGSVIVTLDGKDVTQIAAGTPLEAGQAKATIEIDAPPSEQQPAAAPPPPLALRPAPPAQPKRQRAWVIGAAASAGAGLVGLAVSGVYAVSAIRLYNEAFAKGYCASSPTGEACTQQGLQVVADARSHAGIATGSVIAGAALLAGGAVGYLLAPRERGVEILPSVDAHAAGVSIGGRF
jgi:tetratricopeptide (TPR) repeat protein